MNRGDVVEIVWHYTDRTGSKRRPAIVIQADFLNGVLDDTILVQITGTNHGLGTEVFLDPSVETDSGLINPALRTARISRPWNKSMCSARSDSYPRPRSTGSKRP